ncbi:IclR family transcriptional regulator [Rhodoplanes sp. TEM]|uniref:IclR family transcriptional regulator n=1 Tax=Rhodoplanes tepidamans TaxID=200616 RepID=A0ABT5JDK4_RHOTP|nr:MULTISPECIES: IclR family transcriptional regulator [Rhodoplanes]MDC7787145.1 IclR family transcriptional regulator [Rhodoplanes tepidamans]MDC7984291.1 IclR family transcriptional regulator [Rhodoplanes sp. TEM]MDQ0356088.1 DNA-binding IclR family transcriptional regulator [Rhodoplanes tepidamans]
MAAIGRAGAEKSERQSAENQSVARALAVLDLLAEQAEPLGVREIARRLGLAPSIAQRLIRTLANAGYLEQVDATLRYRIGYKAFHVGNAFVGQSSLHAAVMPELYALAEQEVSGFLGVRRDRSVVYLATVQSTGPIAVNHRPGAQTHLHSTAMGKALLAEMSDEEVRALLSHRPLPKLTERTKVALPQLVAELATIRRLGYATSDQENRQGFFSVGAVVRDATGAAVAVISGAVPTAGLKSQDRGRIARLVLTAATNASRRLGAPAARAVLAR